jgi:serine O-acetyltransferase
VKLQDGIEATATGLDLSSVVASLCSANYGLSRATREPPRARPLPSRVTLISIVEDLRSVLFPGYFGVSELTDENKLFYVGATLDRVLRELQEQVHRGLCFVCDRDAPQCPDCFDMAKQTTREFLTRLPEVRRRLSMDVQAAFRGDPAATSPDEAIFCYPGLQAVTNFRLAHELHLLGVPLLPRIITEHAHSITGIDIHPGASIGDGFFIDHGTGVVIGETSVIGNGVRIYQGVTLGAKSFPLDDQGRPLKGIPRHPQVEDDVVIYSGATILGRVTIGRGAVIGGNVWVTEDVSPGAKVTQAHWSQERFERGAGI